MDILSIFKISNVVSQVCGPMEENVTEEFSKISNLFKENQDGEIPVLGTGFGQVPGGSVDGFHNRSWISHGYIYQPYLPCE